jgi:hypothetical protein
VLVSAVNPTSAHSFLRIAFPLITGLMP